MLIASCGTTGPVRVDVVDTACDWVKPIYGTAHDWLVLDKQTKRDILTHNKVWQVNCQGNTLQTGETFTGKISRRQTELVNGFVALASETGQWLYFAPADVKRVEFTPVPAEKSEQPAEQTTE